MIHAGGEQSQRGVALLLHERTARSVTKIDRCSDRILRVKMQTKLINITIVQVYMPTSAADDEEIDTIYDHLEGMLDEEKGTEYVVLMGDWNAVVGEGRDSEYVGMYGLGKRNERGQKLVDFFKRQQLLVTNTWFKQEKRRIYTWKQPGNLARYQLEYILVSIRYRNSVKSAYAYPGADADTDHNLVMMKSKVQLKQLQRKKSRRRWDREKLKCPSISQDFAEKVNEGVEEQDQKSTEEG